jgi:cytochrome b6-f complex iron-sulfur subunit
MSGINFEGPAPRPLERVKISLADDGQVLIDTGRLFKQEAGQWNDPESFLSLS